MIKLRPELRAIVDDLTRTNEATQQVSLDSLGDAIGARAVSHDEIDAMIEALEQAGRQVVANPAGQAVQWLGTVLAAIRHLKAEQAHRPSLADITRHTGLPTEHVRTALMLAKVMQR